MASIAEIRQQYPQYADMSDEQLAQGLHRKYYADMPYEEFAAKVGLQAAPQAPRSFGQDIGRAVGLTGRAVATGLAALPLTAAEGGAGIGNLVNRAMGREGNYSPTQDFESLLNRVFPQPETALEKGAQIGGSMLAGARVPGQPQIPARPASSADRVIAEGVKHQVPVYYDDIGGAVSKKIGTAAESLGPLGTGSGRGVQAEAARAAAGEIVERFSSKSGDDVPVLIQKGLQAKLAGLKRGAGNLYGRVDKLLAGSGPVDDAAFKQVIAARIAKERQLGSAADEATIATLERYLNAPAGDFAHMRAIRSALGDDIAGYYTGKGAGSVGKRGATALQEAKDAIDASMAAHAKKTGGAAYDAWRKADQFYRTNIVPFKEAGFKDLAKTAEPEKVWRYLLANNTGSRAVRMYNGLDRAGRSAVKYGLVREAMENATSPKGTFSPAKFAKYFEDHDQAVATFFKGKERQDIDGFVNLMRHVERAGQYAENPPTGNRLIPYLVGGAAVMEPTAAAGIAGSGLAVQGLFQTQVGRGMLIAASKMKPGSPELERLIVTITRYVASGALAGQANDASP